MDVTHLAVPVRISTPSLLSWSVTTSVSAVSTFLTLKGKQDNHKLNGDGSGTSWGERRAQKRASSLGSTTIARQNRRDRFVTPRDAACRGDRAPLGAVGYLESKSGMLMVFLYDRP